jgi:hypothetical protein
MDSIVNSKAEAKNYLANGEDAYKNNRLGLNFFIIFPSGEIFQINGFSCSLAQTLSALSKAIL